MKSSLLQHRREGPDVNQSRRSGRCRSSVTARKNQGQEISVLSMGRPGDCGANLQPSMCLQAAARLAEDVYVLARSRRLLNLSRPKRTASNPLPPISTSRVTTARMEQTRSSQAQRPANKLLMEKAVCQALIAQGRRCELSKSYKIRAVRENKAAAQPSEPGSGLIKQTFDDHLPAPTQTTPDTRSARADVGPVVMPLGVKHDASLPVTKEQRGFCSDDSAIETESEGSRDKRRLEGLEEEGSEDEYYTEQRISEWVLRVNASLFSVGDSDRTSQPVEEQDVATVKIVYSGDWSHLVIIDQRNIYLYVCPINLRFFSFCCRGLYRVINNRKAWFCGLNEENTGREESTLILIGVYFANSKQSQSPCPACVRPQSVRDGSALSVFNHKVIHPSSNSPFFLVFSSLHN